MRLPRSCNRDDLRPWEMRFHLPVRGALQSASEQRPAQCQGPRQPSALAPPDPAAHRKSPDRLPRAVPQSGCEWRIPYQFSTIAFTHNKAKASTDPVSTSSSTRSPSCLAGPPGWSGPGERQRQSCEHYGHLYPPRSAERTVAVPCHNFGVRSDSNLIFHRIESASRSLRILTSPIRFRTIRSRKRAIKPEPP